MLIPQADELIVTHLDVLKLVHYYWTLSAFSPDVLVHYFQC